MKDFWISCGHHLLDRGEGGGLVFTDEFLKVYFARPELTPPPDAGVVERTLHAALLADPRLTVSDCELSALDDPDARENWQLALRFRDHLLRHTTLEAAYAALMRGDAAVATPPLFINQLTHVILRNALDGCEDPYVLRAAELLFRAQRVTLHEGALIAADEEKIGGVSGMPLSPLVSMLGVPAAAQIDVMNDGNAPGYWERSNLFDMAIDLSTGRQGLAALAQAMTHWTNHMLGVEVRIEPLKALREAKFSWYVGLNSEGTKIGDQLWNGEVLDDVTASRVIGIFRLDFTDPSPVIDKFKGEPVYLILAMSADKLLRMKPQNLITGLPVQHLEAAS